MPTQHYFETSLKNLQDYESGLVANGITEGEQKYINRRREELTDGLTKLISPQKTDHADSPKNANRTRKK